MKFQSKVIQTFFSLLIIINCLSCQDKELVKPSEVMNESSPEQTASELGGYIEIGPKYTLIKHMGNTLEYYPDGKLKKVGMSPGSYYLYTYNGNISVTQDYYFQNKAFEQVVYLLDEKGRCYESIDKQTNQPDVHRYYSYNSNNQLKYLYMKYGFSNRQEFLYDANGNLSGMNAYQNGLVAQEFTYAYETATYPLQIDHYRLNPSIWNVDTYLKIFGKFNTHLLRKTKIKNIKTNSTTSVSLY